MPWTPPQIHDLWFGSSGPRDAKIAIVAESWGATEQWEKLPLVGESGKEFTRMLSEAGIRREDCFLTNCWAAQPPSNDATHFFEPKDSGAARWKGLQPTPWAKAELLRMYQQLRVVSPTLVIACGNYAFWALTGEDCVSFGSSPPDASVKCSVPTGISSWRGSMLLSCEPELPPQTPILPIYHPAAILRAWYNRAVTVHDLTARVPLALRGDWRPTPPPTIHAMPTFAEANKVLDNWISHAFCGSVLRLSHDIETARNVITCMAFADGPYSAGSTALVIPLVRPERDNSFASYWSADEEALLTRKLIALWSHPNVRIEGQNYNYDTQWIEAFYGSRPNLDFDTMLAHHLLWPGTPKALDYISSLYNHYYWYWKDDNKEWDVKGNFEQHLRYNAEDALRTYECATELRAQIIAQGFGELWEIEKRKNNELALPMMRRGIAIDRKARAEMAFNLQSERARINDWLRGLIPQAFLEGFAPKNSKSAGWWESTHQQKTLFFELLGIAPQKNRKTGNPSLDDAALENLKKKSPEFSRIWKALSLQRSISVFHNTFIEAKLEPDGRMKCSFNTAGTETFRWSSSTNAFWRGTNLQNIPKGEED